MKFRTRFLLLLANVFVAFYCWTEYKHGMPLLRALLLLVVFATGVNLALILGKKLGENRARRR